MFETVMETPLGALHLAASPEGLQKALFVEEPGRLPPAEIPVLLQAVDELSAYFRGNLREFSVPLAPAGTAFQLRVWEALNAIPYGHTISYLTLARRLGDEKVIRAAASANGRNPLSIFIPCHRVIGQDGKLVGYAGGLARKKWLLAHEARHAHGIEPLF